MRVLQLTVYPIEQPRHGGQARCANLRAALEAQGHEVRTLAVYEPEHYGGDAVGAHDIPFPGHSTYRKHALPLCVDYASGDFLAAVDGARQHLDDVASSLRPDVLLLEHPWHWPAAEHLRARSTTPPSIVYSSHNIEAPLKAAILAGVDPDAAERIVASIEARERALCAAADLCIAVTDADADVLRGFGARRVIVASNGIVERRVDERHLRDWQWFLGGKRFALFVGSAYPPNAVGFWDMMGPSLAFLPPDERVLAVGGVCKLLVEHPTYLQWEGVNAARLETAGVQSEDALGVLLTLASCILLPITFGGGSNIKTAEAIFANRPVIGTTHSLRGYEFARRLPHVHCTDDPVEFRRLVRLALDERLPAPQAADDPALRASVLWRHTLAGVPAAIASLRAPAGARGALLE
jgi:hypothetical protein